MCMIRNFFTSHGCLGPVGPTLGIKAPLSIILPQAQVRGVIGKLFRRPLSSGSAQGHRHKYNGPFRDKKALDESGCS